MFERELELSDVSKEVFKVFNVGLIGVMVHWSNVFYCFYSLTSHSQRPKGDDLVNCLGGFVVYDVDIYFRLTLACFKNV